MNHLRMCVVETLFSSSVGSFFIMNISKFVFLLNFYELYKEEVPSKCWFIDEIGIEIVIIMQMIDSNTFFVYRINNIMKHYNLEFGIWNMIVLDISRKWNLQNEIHLSILWINKWMFDFQLKWLLYVFQSRSSAYKQNENKSKDPDDPLAKLLLPQK